jgi:F0F1-type ATP synthase assembly protein I
MPAERPPAGRGLPVGLMVAGSEMATFTILGLALDFGLGTMPGFTIGLTLAGLGIAFFHLVKMSKALTAASGKKPNHPDGPPPPADGGGA